ncbi:hypothetical protein PLESTF_001039000 [Pleodorina starrii]|nr:hypothetical protein PLESTF_001039000 [Pleodorina starrii]
MVEVGLGGAEGEVGGDGGVSEDVVEGGDREELAEGVGEPQFGGEVRGAGGAVAGAQGGGERDDKGSHEVGEEAQLGGGGVGDGGVEDMQRAGGEGGEVGGRNGATLLPTVLQCKEAAGGAAAVAPAPSVFGVGGEGTRAERGGGEVSGDGVGFEASVETGLGGGAEGIEALGPHHFQTGGLALEVAIGGADDDLQGEEDETVGAVGPKVMVEGGSGGALCGGAGGILQMPAEPFPTGLASLTDVDGDSGVGAAGEAFRWQVEDGVNDPGWLGVGGESGMHGVANELAPSGEDGAQGSRKVAIRTTQKNANGTPSLEHPPSPQGGCSCSAACPGL